MIKRWQTPCSCELIGNPTEDELLNYSKENHCKPAMEKICITGYSEQTSKFIQVDCDLSCLSVELSLALSPAKEVVRVSVSLPVVLGLGGTERLALVFNLRTRPSPRK